MEISLSELAARLGLERIGEADPILRGAMGFESAGPDQITFVDARKLLRRLGETRAGAVIVPEGAEPVGPALRSADPRADFARVLALFAPDRDRILPPEIHPSAVVHPDALLEADVALGPGCVVGPGARVGAGCRLGAHVVLEADVTLGRECCLYHGSVVRERCRLGDRVILHAGAVIGTDGFGYHPGPAGLVKIPQIGIVVLEDDVEIGANSCVDRATTGVTRVGAGTKIDNLCQIGHNVDFGRHGAMSAQSGVSGSCRIGDGVTFGGQTGVADHLEVGSGARIAARTAVISNVPAGAAVIGYPAEEFAKGMRLMALYRRLPELQSRLAALEKRLGPEIEIVEE